MFDSPRKRGNFTASRQGAWEMRSETGGDCLNPTMMNHDYTVVNAY